MNRQFIFWSVVLVLALSVTGLAIRSLAVSGIPLSESLILRGLVSLSLVVVWARVRGLSLRPKSMRTQFVRALIAGLALSFFSLSYNWLSASTISVLSNVDVPMLVILGSLIGQNSSRKSKILSLISIVLLVFYGLNVQQHSHWFYGLSTLGIGLFLLCFGYYFIKKSMNEENRAITVLTPSLAIIAYGLLQTFFDAPLTTAWDVQGGLVGLVSGVGMFGAYYATMKLYDLADIAMAEFPTLLSSLAIQPLETLFFNEPLVPSQLALTAVFIVCTYFILKPEVTCAESA